MSFTRNHLPKYNITELQKQLENVLTEKRYAHTIGVEHTAACLAMRYGEDIEKASVAGLLHDCAKCLPNEILLQECEKYHIEITSLEKRNPHLLHGKLGAFYAKNKYGIDDEAILQAIRYHTTGRPAMTLLEKIIFIADYVEPLRKEIPGLSEIRGQVFINIDKAVCMALENTLDYLKHTAHGQEKEIDEMTAKAYEYYKEDKED